MSFPFVRGGQRPKFTGIQPHGLIQGWGTVILGATLLQSLAQTLKNHGIKIPNCILKTFYLLRQVCLIRVGAKLCRDTGPPGSTFPTSGLTASPQPQHYLLPRRPKAKQCRFHCVMASTLDFESSDLNSNLGGTGKLSCDIKKKIKKFVSAFC